MTEKMDKFLGIKPPVSAPPVADEPVADEPVAEQEPVKTIEEEIEDEDILAAGAEKPSKKKGRRR